jgi:large subunit ribosomal protein L21
MYAVIQTGGKQYRVTPGLSIQVEKLPGNAGDSITFDQVLIAADGDQVQVGKPLLENVKVTGQLKRHGKSRKVIIFKYKRRKNFRRKRGHRQEFSLVQIENITM